MVVHGFWDVLGGPDAFIWVVGFHGVLHRFWGRGVLCGFYDKGTLVKVLEFADFEKVRGHSGCSRTSQGMRYA